MIRGYKKRCENGFEKRWDERRWGEPLESHTIFYNCTGFQVYAANPWFSEWAYQSESSRCLCCILCDLLRFEKGHFISPNYDSDTHKSINSATGHDPTWSNCFPHLLAHFLRCVSFIPFRIACASVQRIDGESEWPFLLVEAHFPPSWAGASWRYSWSNYSRWKRS